MKKTLFIICAILGLSVHLAAQGYFVHNIYIQGGMVNSIDGYNLTVGSEKLFGDRKDNGLGISFNFQKFEEYYNTAWLSLKLSDYSLNVHYKKYFNLPKLPKISLYTGAGVLGGVEHTSKAENSTYIVSEKNEFLCGVFCNTGGEYAIKRYALFVEGTYFFTGYNLFRINLGLKYKF